MLVKNHILLFMLKDQPHPHSFPFLLLLHTSQHILETIGEYSHTQRKSDYSDVEDFIVNTVGWRLTCLEGATEHSWQLGGTAGASDGRIHQAIFILLNHSHCYMISSEVTGFIDSGESRWLRHSRAFQRGLGG